MPVPLTRGAAGIATSCYFLAPHPQQEHVPVLQQGAAGAQAHPCPPGLQPHSVLQQVLQQGSVMVVVVLGGGGEKGPCQFSDGIENCEVCERRDSP